ALTVCSLGLCRWLRAAHRPTLEDPARGAFFPASAGARGRGAGLTSPRVSVGALIASASRAREPALASLACLLLLGGCGGSAPSRARREARAEAAVGLARHASVAASPAAAPAGARLASCPSHPP